MTKKSQNSLLRLFTALKIHLRGRARSGQIKWGLGVSTLIPEWRALFTVKDLSRDLWASLMVSGAAIPLSLAIALGAQVDPGMGLISAVIGGCLCALFGGARLAVSGPANSMLVLIALIVQKAGLEGLFFVGLCCGAIQLVIGGLGFGRFVRYLPIPLVAGFTAGLGVIILVGQLPRALGLPVSPEGDVLSIITHMGSLLHESQPRVLFLAAFAMIIAQTVSRLNPRIPSSLFAVLVPTLLAVFADWDVPRVGDFAAGFAWPKLPSFPVRGGFELFEMSILLFALASLESRLSSVAVDKLIPGERHDSDQELIGQGLGNIFASCFSGIPITGVLARSVLNIKAGARTRRSALFHGLFVLLVLVFGRSLLSQIPVAALSGVLLSIAINLINPKEVVKIWRTSPVETIVYWITLATVVAVDLMAGVQMGIFAALLIALWNLGQTRLFFHSTDNQEIIRVSMGGNITFLSSRNFDLLAKRVGRLPYIKAVVLDLGDVKLLDSSGASMMLEFIKEMKEKNIRVVLKSLNRESRDVLKRDDSDDLSTDCHVTSESEIAEALLNEKVYDPRERLLFGVERYRRERKKAYEELFDQLGKAQKPHTLFITCSDSRINPTLITSSEPGELFIVRNVGNIIPPMGTDDTPAEGAAVEFALGALGVEEIIICGHTRCGALKGVFQGIDPKEFPSVAKWVEPIGVERAKHPHIHDPEDFAKVHVVEQARNILSYPIVRRKISEGQVKVHCWIYDVQSGEFLEWSGKEFEFVPVGPESLHGNIQALLSPTQSDY
ncbi:MAG: STAS domain-containing protein [Proteobacteria bacterium]|nr:STAS domain-containing protein [Pseudomonadota bacterium]